MGVVVFGGRGMIIVIFSAYEITVGSEYICVFRVRENDWLYSEG